MAGAPFVLGLDVSKTRTGICYGRVGETPRFLSIESAGLSDVAAMRRLGAWLIDFTKIEHPDAVFFEGQINMAAFMGKYDEEKGKVRMSSNPATTITLAKIIGIVEFVCDMKSLRCEQIAVSTARKAFLGDGGLKKEIAKPAGRRLCEVLGWNAGNHDESDAAAVWFAGCTRVAPHRAHPITPMMQGRAIGGNGQVTRSGALL